MNKQELIRWLEVNCHFEKDPVLVLLYSGRIAVRARLKFNGFSFRAYINGVEIACFKDRHILNVWDDNGGIEIHI